MAKEFDIQLLNLVHILIELFQFKKKEKEKKFFKEKERGGYLITKKKKLTRNYDATT